MSESLLEPALLEPPQPSQRNSAAGPLRSIGEVLAMLQEDFPGITISKIRFLETEGLVEPQRTASGYRKFSPADVERLRYVLTAQQHHYLPLRVIRDHLDALDRGLEPPALVDVSPRLPQPEDAETLLPVVPVVRTDVRLSRAEVLTGASVGEQLLVELEDHGLVRPEPRTSPPLYSLAALEIARVVGELSRFGIEPRHLRGLRSAAQREAGLIEQAVRPLSRSAGDDGSVVAETAVRLAELSARVHALLLNQALRESADLAVQARSSGPRA